MTERLVILGTGGNAYDVLDTVDAINSTGPAWNVVGFLTDGARPGAEYLGLPVLGALKDAATHEDCWFVSAIWNDRVFKTLHDVLATTRLPLPRFATLVHPGAAVSRRARLGHDVIVHHGATIGGNVIARRPCLGRPRQHHRPRHGDRHLLDACARCRARRWRAGRA